MTLDALLTIAFVIGLIAGCLFSRACWLAGYRQGRDECDSEWLATAESVWNSIKRKERTYIAVEVQEAMPLVEMDYASFPERELPPYRLNGSE